MAEETKRNPYIDEGLLQAQQQYNPRDNKQFESRFTVGDKKDKKSIMAESNQKIQTLLVSYLERVGEKRNEDIQSSNLGTAEAFISFIKYTCIDIIRSKCIIRRTLQYMFEIIESKPAPDTFKEEKDKKLWNNLSNLYKELLEVNSEMMVVAHRYFGFLLKFWEALGEFCRQQTKLKRPAMEISVNALQQHLYDFIQFKQNYDSAVAKVEEAAQGGLKLFDEFIGGQQIKDAFDSRNKIQDKLNKLFDELKEKELESIDIRRKLNEEKAENAGKIAMNKEEIKYFQGIYKTMEEWEKHEKEAFKAAQKHVKSAENMRKIFEGHKADYIKQKTIVDAEARNLKKETKEALIRDKKYSEERKKQIDRDARDDKNRANTLDNKANQLLDQAKSTRSDAVSTLNSAKYKSDYETVHHYSYSSRRSWWGWSRSYSYSHTTSQRHTGEATRWRNIGKDLNKMADDIQNSAMKLKDKAEEMKNNAIERNRLEKEYEQKQYEQSIINNQRMLELAKQIEDSSKIELENADLMGKEASKQDEVIKKRASEAAKQEAKLKEYQALKQEQEKRNVANIGRLNKENETLVEKNKSLDKEIETEEKHFKTQNKERLEKITKKQQELEKVEERILAITKQIGCQGKDQLIHFANMTMEIFPNLENVKNGAAGIKVAFEDFALVLSLRINTQITIAWYFQITSIFDEVASKIIANALNKQAFHKMNDLNYYDEYGKKAEKRFDKKIAPIITNCMRVKGSNDENDDNMDDREGINDNDDEKSSVKKTNTANKTKQTSKYIEVEDKTVIDNYVDKLRKLFIKKKNIYGKEEQGIKGWMELSKEQANVNREWIIEISPSLCYFFNNMSRALKFAMDQMEIESYDKNVARINSISTEIKKLLQKEESSKLPTFTFEQKPDPWIRYLKQWKLDKYKDKFEEFGYDDSSTWQYITEKDMKNDLGFKKGDILKFKSRRKEIKEGGDEESDDGSKQKRKKGKKGKKTKGRKKKKYESSDSDDEGSSSDESGDSDDDDDDDSSSDDGGKSKKRSKKSKKEKKKKKRKKRDESSDDDEDESSDSDDDESSDDDKKKKKKKQNKKKGKKKKDKKKKKKSKKKKDTSSEEETDTESDDDSKDESNSDESSSDNDSKRMKKKKNKAKIKKQNKKKTKKKDKKKKRKESTDESESESGSGSNGSSSSESEEKPKKKSKGKKDKDKKKRKKGKKNKKNKSKKKVSDDDESDESSSD